MYGVMYQSTEVISMREVKEAVRTLKNERVASLHEVTGQIKKLSEWVTGCEDCVVDQCVVVLE